MEAYAGLADFDKALALCLKTMEIAEARSGENSTELARVPRIFTVVYTGLSLNEETLEKIELVRMVIERLSFGVEFSIVEIDG